MYKFKRIAGEQIARSLCRSAKAHREKNNLEMSEKLYLEALKWREELWTRDKEYYLPLMAQTLANLAVVSKERNNYLSAKSYYKKSIYMGEKLSIIHVEALAKNYANLADLYRREYDYEEAKVYYTKALSLPEGLSQNRELNVYNHLAIVCKELNLYKETKEAYIGALTIYKSLVSDESDEYREELATTLYKLGALYFKNRRFNRAGEVYLFALELLLYLDDLEPNRYSDMCAMIFYRLGKIYTSQLEDANALASYRTALNYYISMAEKNPLKYAPYVAKVFSDLAVFHKVQNKMDSAQYFHLKAIDIYMELTHYNESKFALELVASLIDGVVNYGQHTLSLYQAEIILEEYSEEQTGDELLEKIHSIREETGVLS